MRSLPLHKYCFYPPFNMLLLLSWNFVSKSFLWSGWLTITKIYQGPHDPSNSTDDYLNATKRKNKKMVESSTQRLATGSDFTYPGQIFYSLMNTHTSNLSNWPTKLRINSHFLCTERNASPVDWQLQAIETKIILIPPFFKFSDMTNFGPTQFYILVTRLIWMSEFL